ncbi:MAG: winged helix DNA-binding domain-containing protein [Trueperaceae bacterium]
MNQAKVALHRLHVQGITTQKFATPAEVVRWHCAVQAQDYLSSLWAIGLRMQASSESHIERAVAEKSIVRTWPMRGTIHFVAPEDARWMLKHFTPRVIARSRGRYRQLELDDAVFSKSSKVLTKALQGGKSLTRNALYEVLEKANISTSASRGPHIIGHLAQEGLLCFGARHGKQPTFVLLEEWLPSAKFLERDEAIAELTKRYFSSHGPATLQDFAWWSGLTMTEAKEGLEDVKTELHQKEVEGQTYWFTEDGVTVNSEKAYLLPFFDEFLVAYKDRTAALEPSHTKQVNAGGGLLNPTIVLNGQVIGTWKRTLKKAEVIIHLSPFARLEDSQLEKITRAAQGYAEFIGKAARVIL